MPAGHVGRRVDRFDDFPGDAEVADVMLMGAFKILSQGFGSFSHQFFG